jgi:hypothetical protein
MILITRDLNPHRRMIAGLFPSAHHTVDTTSDKTFINVRAEQEVIDT